MKKKSKTSKRKAEKKKSNKFDKYFLLSWRKLWIIVVLSFVSILLHNLWYAIFKFEEAVFFTIVVIIIPIYFLICIIYSIIKLIKNKDKKFFWNKVISIIIGLILGTIIIKLGYFKGPWFFGLFSLLFALISYLIIRKIKNQK
jgi:O-antigen/teichoic acid export membrane protein